MAAVEGLGKIVWGSPQVGSRLKTDRIPLGFSDYVSVKVIKKKGGGWSSLLILFTFVKQCFSVLGMKNWLFVWRGSLIRCFSCCQWMLDWDSEQCIWNRFYELMCLVAASAQSTMFFSR